MLWVVVGSRGSGKTTLLNKLQESPKSMMTFECHTKDEVDAAVKYAENASPSMDIVITVEAVELLPYWFWRKHTIIEIVPGLPEKKTTLQIVCDTR